MKVGKGCGALGSVLALTVIAPAVHAETRAGLDVSAGVRAATNPYLVAGPSTSSVASTLEVAPHLRTGSDISSLSLSGVGRWDHYFSRYNDDVSASANATYDRRLSERTRFSLGGFFATSMGGSRDLLRRDALPLGGTISTPVTPVFVDPLFDTGLTPVTGPLNDVSLTGARFRQYNYGANARVSSRISARGSIDVGGAINLFESPSPIAADYRQYMADAGYNHIINERAQVGLHVAYTNIDYRRRTAGDGEVITPALTASYKLNERLSISGSAGASIASIRQLDGTRAHTTGVAAQLSLCNQSPRSQLCLNGSRNVQATSLGGVSTVTSISLTDDLRLSERDTLSVYGSYGQTEQPNASVVQFGRNRSKLATAAATYSRRMSERLYLTASPQFEKVWDQGLSRDANFAIMVGLRYRLGQ